MPKIPSRVRSEANGSPVKVRIPLDLASFSVRVSSLKFDPLNARLHPERNIEEIMISLQEHGQQKLIVARKDTRVVIAGNGTLTAAKRLGWTHIACRFADMGDTEAIKYGLRDNRAAELAKWNYEVMSRIKKLLRESGESMPGWTDGQLRQLRLDEDQNIQAQNQAGELVATWSVLVECGSEEKQLEMIERLEAEGLKCRALSF